MNRLRTAKNGVPPEGWLTVRLGDVAELRKKQITPTEDDLRIYVGLEHVASGGTLIGHSKAGISISNKTEFHCGDTLYGKLRPNLRKVVRVNFDGVCSTDLLAIYGKELVDHRYLGYVLQSNPLHEHAMRRAAGTKMPRTSWTHLRTYQFRCPSLNEQWAIAGVLDSVDEAIERTEAIIAATDTLRDALICELLTRGVPGRHTEWKDIPGIDTIPADWDVVRLGDVCEPPEYGATASAQPHNPDLPRYVRITDLTDDGRLNNDDPRSADPAQVDGYELEHGDLLFARSGATVGKTFLYREADGPCIYAGYLIRFRPVTHLVLPEYLELATHSQPYYRWVASMFRAGAQPNINANEYASLPLCLPPIGEQRVITALLDGVNSNCSRLRGRKRFAVEIPCLVVPPQEAE